MMKRHVTGIALLGVALAVSGASAANVGAWVGELPKKLASGADVPPLETTGPRSIFVPGDFARFEQVWARLDKGEPIRIAVIGGSITQGAGASRPERRWGESFCAGWRRAFPNARIDFVNAGIGATGSEIGAFRLKRDVLDKKPDVVVVEFAVNDRNDKDRAESYEGVVRQLLKEPRGIAVILLGMVGQGGGNAQEWQGKVARHYGLPYVSWRDALFYPYVKEGTIKWSDLSPDTVHPNDTGHAYAAALLNRYLAERYQAWKASGRAPAPIAALPTPLFGTRYDKGEFCLMKDVKILENKGFFPLRDHCWGEGLACTNAGDKIVFEVEGATVALLYRVGREPFNWGKVDVKIDGRPVEQGLNCYRDQWWWYTPSLFLCKDTPGRHVVEVVALPEKDAMSKGYGCHLTGLLVNGAAESWKMSNYRAWAREKDAVKLSAMSDSGFEVRHTGGADWCVNGFPLIAVKHGDTFELTCETEALADMPDSRTVCMSVILRDAKGVEISWSYGGGYAKPGEPIQTAFMVPAGVTTIQPRVLGHGVVGARVRNVRAMRTGNALPKTGPLEFCAFANGLLRGRVGGAGFEVEDVRTGRTWKPVSGSRWAVEELERRVEADGSVRAMFINPETMKSWKAIYRVEKDRPEVVVTLEGEGAMSSPFAYPAAFASRKGDRLIVPLNEGISYPADDPDGIPGRLVAYGGHGICMAFFGVQDDATGAGWMAILETPDDVALLARRDAETNLWTLGPSWEDQKKQFGYARRIRYVFLDKGGYVAMCKRYRAHAKAIGKFKSFSEKAKERPLVDLLLGAPNVWCWEKDKIAVAKELKASGIDRFLWSAGGNEEQVKFLSEMPDVLVSRYDVYQDIYHPDQLKKLGWKSGCNTEAWPQDIIWNSANSNDWRHAWPVKAKDGTWTYCAMMCDSVAPNYERRNVSKELKTKPYNTRFIDTTVAAPWQTCWNPAHPMTRSDSRHWKMELLRILGDEFHLVVGSETGHDASVPFCDYYEGMLSLGPYRVPDSGRNISQIWTNVPPRVAKYQVGENYRLPLWELVYHECVCAHWYWGDYNNKLPDLWWKRDLFNVLYGTMGMYIFNNRQWKEDKEKFVRSYRITSPVARATGYSEMLDHRILSPDRTVQESRFADGTVVTVNFGDAPFTLPDGTTLAARRHLVRLGGRP